MESILFINSQRKFFAYIAILYNLNLHFIYSVKIQNFNYDVFRKYIICACYSFPYFFRKILSHTDIDSF